MSISLLLSRSVVSVPISSKCWETKDCSRRIWTLFFMLSFYVQFAMRWVHGVVTLLRLTTGKLMPSYAGCSVMDIWVQFIILTTWYVLLMLNCFRRCVKCIIALIIFCLKWKLPIIHCVKGITILNYLLGTTVYLGTHLSFAVFFSNLSDYFFSLLTV